MANIKISEMAEIAEIPANTQNFLLVGVDTTPLIPITLKVRSSMLYDYIDNLGLQAFAQANTANTNAATSDQRAVTSGLYANSAYNIANTSLTYALASNANSMIIVTGQPNSPKGKVGDVSGLVYLSNVALYYCTGTYNGSSNIWSKITSTDSW